MATESISTQPDVAVVTRDARAALAVHVRTALQMLSSLKLTVVLFSLAIIVVLIGSLAQAQKDVWVVVHEYFRTGLAWIDLKDCFPPSFFPAVLDFDWNSLPVRYIPFPGGWSIGFVMAANLICAHALRYRLQARGTRMWAGLAVLVTGILVTWIVVASGMNADGFQTDPILSYGGIWKLMLATAGAAALAMMVTGLWFDRLRIVERVGFVACGAVLSLVIAGLILQDSLGQLSDASMRILWQLAKAEFASMILLVGCILLFRKRAGVVLLHTGVGVLMVSELLVGMTVTENLLTLGENQSSNYVFDLRERELAVIDHSGTEDRVVVVPESTLIEALNDPEHVISDDRLAFDIRVVKFLRNTTGEPRRVTDADDNPATAGTGTSVIIDELKPASGMDSSVDMSTVYVELIEKTSSQSLGTYMASMALRPEIVMAGGELYDIQFRLRRTYKPWTVTLLDVRKDDYIGTTTPRNYSSDIRLVDPERNVDRELRIWMNNPLRYLNETFYQTSYHKDELTGAESTSLQVVNNRGWMLPYMACMIVGTGLLAQFTLALTRFIRRRDEQPGPRGESVEETEPSEQQAWWMNPAIVAPLVAALVGLAWIGSKARPPRTATDEYQAYEFGKIPVVSGGRVQPVDSVARSTVRVLTNGKSSVIAEMEATELKDQWDEISAGIVDRIDKLQPNALSGFEGGVPELVEFIEQKTYLSAQEIRHRILPVVTTKKSAVYWLLDIVAGRKIGHRHCVIRIDEPQLLSALDLRPRKGALYSPAEIEEHYSDLRSQLFEARKQLKADEDRLSRFQRRLLALDGNLRRIITLALVLQPFEFDRQQPHSELVRAAEVGNVLRHHPSGSVLAVPTLATESDETWDAVAIAALKYGLHEYAAARSARTRQALVDELVGQLPQELVYLPFERTVRLLRHEIEPDSDESLRARAVQVLENLDPQETFLRAMMSAIIAAGGEGTPEDMYAEMSEKEKVLLYRHGLGRTLGRMMNVVSERTKNELDRRIRSGGIPTDDELNDIVRKMTDEAVSLVIGDAELTHKPNEAVTTLGGILTAWNGILTAWNDRKTLDFNRHVSAHRDAVVARGTTVAAVTPRVDFEAWFNHAAPAFYASFLYLIVFVLAAGALLGWSETLNRSAFALCFVTFLVHTLALFARIYISERPPVTNLYSSAVFIGWGCVLFGLVFERITRNGIGNIVSAVAGASTLGIAYLLTNSGDTFEVLQAVLDTQFWLSTHVVCITLGYSTTFLAGLFGIVYILRGVLTRTLSDQDRHELTRMTYGTICFAIFFSFVGTVLGGLWADDSWGRFWGWDPKENGALIIVLWNAIVLHARWGGMVRGRGIAVLAVAGNICTSWSWFGVNELSAGLHNYGFTEGRLNTLCWFIFSQLIVMVIGCLPAGIWLSSSSRKKGADAATA